MIGRDLMPESKRVKQNALSERLLAFAAASMLAIFSGCASGSYTSAKPPNSGGGGTTTNPNPPSLPPLTPATSSNTYAGTQAPGALAPSNLVSLAIDQNSSAYGYRGIAVSTTPSNPVPNSNGLFDAWIDFRNLGDTSGTTGVGGPQYFGLAIEHPSRFSFFAYNSSQQLAAMVPKQSSACLTPTASATYEFITLFGPGFVPATDTAWGTVQLSASGSSFKFSGASQYTATSAKATTSLIPFGRATCTSQSGLGYVIDTPASAATGNTEMRAFLGPTGLLAVDLQGTDGSGNPLALPGVLGMVQPASAIDLGAVTGTATNPATYQAFVYQPQNTPAVQYGIFTEYPVSLLSSFSSSVFTAKNQAGMMGGWQGMTSFTNPFGVPLAGFFFGAQDSAANGLFPHAQFLWSTLPGTACPAGTRSVPGGYCESAAVAMVSQHDGKYVVFVTGLLPPFNDTPTLFLLVQE
jgi:hypothetical protein